MIVVVTGASRGAGKGIAVALGAAGATVYVTGRSVAGADSPHGGTVAETARLITEAGGQGIAVAADHGDDQAVGALFDRIKREHGKLDILVNNAANLIVTTTDGGGFWEKPLEAVELLNVGMRSHFVASYHAAPLLWPACRPNRVRQPSGNRRSSPAGSSRPCTTPISGCSCQDAR
jgi:NAD(P)-dependent dehydrogenase (short-subunit alcohol dehydrogenase family)